MLLSMNNIDSIVVNALQIILKHEHWSNNVFKNSHLRALKT